MARYLYNITPHELIKEEEVIATAELKAVLSVLLPQDVLEGMTFNDILGYFSALADVSAVVRANEYIVVIDRESVLPVNTTSLTLIDDVSLLLQKPSNLEVSEQLVVATSNLMRPNPISLTITDEVTLLLS